MAENMITIQKDGENLETEVLHQLRGNISKSLFINSHRSVNKNTYFDIGVSYPEVIVDRNSTPIVKYISIDSVFSIKAKHLSKKYEVEFPDRNVIHKSFEKKKQNMIRNAENILIGNIGDKLIRISKVQNGLNPIKEILINLYEDGEIPLSEVNTRKGKIKAKNYLDFLSALKFVTIKHEIIYPGNELTKYELTNTSGANIYEKILTDVIRRGYQFIRDELKIYILTPYLELSNSYYLQSYFADKLIKMNALDIERHYSDMYKRYEKKPAYQINANLLELKEVDIIQKESDGYIGYDEILNSLRDSFPVH